MHAGRTGWLVGEDLHALHKGQAGYKTCYTVSDQSPSNPGFDQFHWQVAGVLEEGYKMWLICTARCSLSYPPCYQKS